MSNARMLGLSAVSTSPLISGVAQKNLLKLHCEGIARGDIWLAKSP